MTACPHSMYPFGAPGHADPDGAPAVILDGVPETKVREIIRMLDVPI